MIDLVLQDGQTMVLIGDSITDCGRRDVAAPYGAGYASLFIDMVTAQCPDRGLTYVNRGLGGDRVVGQQQRWQEDVLDHRPDWLSIMIGINDLHSHLREPATGVDLPTYRDAYDEILTRTRERTDAKIVLLEPFYIIKPEDADEFQATVLRIIPDYIAVVHAMSEEHDTRLVRMHDVFQAHLKHRPADTFCPEPVHPNRTGHMVIAWELLRALGG